jgi:hypothetical protein
MTVLSFPPLYAALSAISPFLFARILNEHIDVNLLTGDMRGQRYAPYGATVTKEEVFGYG